MISLFKHYLDNEANTRLWITFAFILALLSPFSAYAYITVYPATQLTQYGDMTYYPATICLNPNQACNDGVNIASYNGSFFTVSFSIGTAPGVNDVNAGPVGSNANEDNSSHCGSGLHCHIMISDYMSTTSGSYYINVHDGQPPFNLIAVIPFQISGGFYITQNATSGPAFDSHTHFVALTPSNGSIISTSTTADFDVTLYGGDDFTTGDILHIEYRLNSRQLGLFALDVLPDQTFDQSIVASGFQVLHINKPVTEVGKYTVLWQIRHVHQNNVFDNVLGFFGLSDFAGNNTYVASTTVFTAEHQNTFDSYVGSTTEAIASSTAHSVAFNTSVCSPSFSFNIVDCLDLIFGWSPNAMRSAFSDFNEDFLTRVPWGYATRTIVLLSGGATTTFPALSVNFPLGNPTQPGYIANDHFTLDTSDMLHGGSNLLNSVHTTFGGDLSVQDVTQPFVRLVIALALMAGIIYDLVGMRRHGGISTSRRTKLA